MTRPKRYVLIVPDGAGDTCRMHGRSPLALARMVYSNTLAREGIVGRVQTLCEDLPRESLVAQLGMLGWDPHGCYPHGRASCELLALGLDTLGERDLAFRGNFVRMEGRTLASYNADYIGSAAAAPIVDRLNGALAPAFPDFQLHHNADFRNTLVIRDADVDPRELSCPSPHECRGLSFDVAQWVAGTTPRGREVAQRINAYLSCVQVLLEHERANMLAPWSPSTSLRLRSFHENTGFEGPAAVVGCMDFLHGLAKAGRLDFFKEGNGRPDTDYAAKGARIVSLFEEGYEFVMCHINGPDEASHMCDVRLKIDTLELVDRHIVGPVVEYFRVRPAELGGMMLAPDHYTNCLAAEGQSGKRADVHSLHPVPFILWGRGTDEVCYFSEDDAVHGKYGAVPLHYLDLLRLLGVTTTRALHVQSLGAGV